MEALKKRIETLEYLVEELIFKLGKNNQRISFLTAQVACLEKELKRDSNVYQPKLLSH
ncbi:hypothetical protein [Heyndrickxia acidicola]|uniref:Uncharacterized protein n=1 Tax=Heyndrickxia acidicola TaxID=209389 RepID=A0ABU6MES6_9BACI|nr:hypothetical protein [Heyndrickxia acidicola]MED1202944.1 hypothetical protein [Heyndrickxia acidicola]